MFDAGDIKRTAGTIHRHSGCKITSASRTRKIRKGERLDIDTLAGELNIQVQWSLRDDKELPFMSLAGVVSTSEQAEVRAQARRYLSDANTSLTLAVRDYIPVRIGPYVEELSPGGTSLRVLTTKETWKA